MYKRYSILDQGYAIIELANCEVCPLADSTLLLNMI